MVYRGHKIESRNGQTMLQIGNSRPFPVRSAIYNEALNASLYRPEVPAKQLSELVRTTLAG